MSDHFIVERDGGVATVTINRPDRRNAIDYEGWQELGIIAGELGHDRTVRAVVFKGAGDSAFSAGADIRDFERYRNNSEQARIYGEAIDGTLDAVESMPKATVAAIKGFCVGGGCDLAMATDIRIAAQDSRFGMPVAKLGLLVSYNEMRRLVRLIGSGNASYLLLSAELIDASEARRIGLVSVVLPPEEIDERAATLAVEMAGLAPLTQSRHKEMLRTVLSNPALDGLTADQDALQYANFDTEDFQEGRTAFLERRPPLFKGL